MPITLNGTTGIGTPAIQIDNSYTLKGVTYLTSGTLATYTVPAGVRALEVTVIGGGGGGGGADGSASTEYGSSSPGGGGGWATGFITSLEASYIYTVGVGGTAGAAGVNNGGTGGTSIFRNSGSTVILQATGGAGGLGQLIDVSVSALPTAGGVGSAVGVSASLFGGGVRSTYGRTASGLIYSIPTSGFCPLIGGGVFYTSANTNGVSATLYGEGGGGAYLSATTNNYAGGAGYQGLIIVREYC